MPDEQTTRLLSAEKLSKHLEAAVKIAADSPYWSEQMRYGAQGAVDFIRGALLNGSLDASVRSTP